ncbi:MAG: HEPN domain-containing protein [Actinomycetota bacterium]|nr:HEPN domain-containing protein [Actinomycetota bacterium]
MPNLLMQRVIEFAPEHATAVAALDEFLDEAVVTRANMVATSFDIALTNYTRSHQQGDYYDRIIDLATALEAVLTGSDDDVEGVGLRLRSRAAALLWTDNDPGRAIFDDVKNLYNLRSRLVHGARIAEKDCYWSSGSMQSRPFQTALCMEWRSHSPWTDCAISCAGHSSRASVWHPETIRSGSSRPVRRSMRPFLTRSSALGGVSPGGIPLPLSA